jgi:hypothetical protein
LFNINVISTSLLLHVRSNSLQFTFLSLSISFHSIVAKNGPQMIINLSFVGRRGFYIDDHQDQ